VTLKGSAAGLFDFMAHDEDAVTELWGCGFNQFGQIDDYGDDVYELARIDYVPPDRVGNGIQILWAGWADLICTLTSSPRAYFLQIIGKSARPMGRV
jgi:hypothetical protein